MQLFALDQLDQIAQIHDQERVEIIERDLDTGAWLLDLPSNDSTSAANQLAAATWPGFEAYDPETGWRFGGYVTSITEIRTATRTTLRFKGKDFQSELQNRLEWPIAADINLFWSTVYGGTIPLTSDAHNTVIQQCGFVAPEYRRIPNLEFGPNPAAGTPKGRRLKGLPMLEVLRTMFTGEAWTARLRLVREPGLTATPSVLRFETPQRPVADVVLDTERSNLGQIEVTDEADAASHIIGMGAEDSGGPARFVTASNDPNFATSWRNRYIETFINRPGTDDVAQLQAACDAQHDELRRDRKVVVDGAEVEGFGQRIDIGWHVPVSVASSVGTTRIELPVSASKLTFRPRDGWRRTIDVGTESLGGPAALLAELGALARKVRQIETELFH